MSLTAFVSLALRDLMNFASYDHKENRSQTASLSGRCPHPQCPLTRRRSTSLTASHKYFTMLFGTWQRHSWSAPIVARLINANFNLPRWESSSSPFCPASHSMVHSPQASCPAAKSPHHQPHPVTEKALCPMGDPTWISHRAEISSELTGCV